MPEKDAGPTARARQAAVAPAPAYDNPPHPAVEGGPRTPAGEQAPNRVAGNNESDPTDPADPVPPAAAARGPAARLEEAGPATFRARLKRRTGLDRAIAFSMLGRGWSAVAGIVSVLLIGRFLSPPQQGYYYTFSSLAALQIIFELGFSFVILQLAAHERVHLAPRPDGSFPPGSPAFARLASVLQQAVRWYSVAALFMLLALSAGGWAFFSRQPSAVAWQLPWFLVVLASSCTFQIDPVVSFLEGCGKIVEVGRLRLSQAMLGNTLAWCALLLHHGLLAPFALIAGQAVAGGLFLHAHRRLLRPLLRATVGDHGVHWATEIWPFQWRIAISWASSYCILQLLNPILFLFRGPAEAGRLGMSASICNSLGAVALAWITTKAAPFGSLIAGRRFAELDTLFFRALRQSTALLAATGALFLLFLAALIHLFPRIGARVVPLPLFALLLLTLVCTHLTVAQAYYLRAHKKEPFLAFWVAIAVLAAVSMTLLARRWGTAGITLGYFACAGLLRCGAATWVFFRKRAEWHAPPPPPAVTSAQTVQ